MRDNKQLGKYVANSNIIFYDSIKSAWYETKPIDQNKLGLFAGVILDTLYFFEGSLKNSEAKYVKRAIVRAVED